MGEQYAVHQERFVPYSATDVGVATRQAVVSRRTLVYERTAQDRERAAQGQEDEGS